MTDYDDIRAATAKAEADDTAEDAAYQAQIDGLNTQLASVQGQVVTLVAQVSALQMQYEAYVKSHPDPTTPAPTPTTRFPGDPGLGKMYVGESVGGGDPTARETKWGAKVGVYRSYFSWGSNQPVADRAKRDLAAGRVPYISIHTGGDGWGPMATGAHDAEIKDLMSKLGALAGPVWLCWDHEPVDNPEKGTPAQFCAMNKRTLGMLPKNVALVPTLQTAPFDPTVGGSQNIAPWYEPGSYTFVGLDTYNHKYYFPAPGGNKYRDAKTVLSVVDLVRAQLGKPDVPIAIAEFGTRTNPASPGQAAGWLGDLVTQAAGKNIPALAYFDSGLNVNDRGTPWSLDDKTDGTDGTERINAYGPLVKAGAHL